MACERDTSPQQRALLPVTAFCQSGMRKMTHREDHATSMFVVKRQTGCVAITNGKTTIRILVASFTSGIDSRDRCSELSISK